MMLYHLVKVIPERFIDTISLCNLESHYVVCRSPCFCIMLAVNKQKLQDDKIHLH